MSDINESIPPVPRSGEEQSADRLGAPNPSFDPRTTAYPSAGIGAGPQTAYAGVGGPGQAPAVIVNVPEQKQSKLPWVILIIVLVIMLIPLILGLVTCSSAMNTVKQYTGIGASSTSTSGNTIAVIHMSSTIAATGSDYITPEGFLDNLTAAENDKNVKAIVLRINSGGGAAASSQEIAQYISECDKPVVVSVADSCYSGAYYAASQADYIYANGASGVGSIGVIITKYDISGLLDNLGISVEDIASGEDKGDTNIYNTLTDEQRAALQQQVDIINDEFIDAVAKGRGLDRATVASLATGETWSGSQALDLGLIDGIGTYEDALDKAAELADIGSNYNVTDFDTESDSSVISSLI